MNKVVPFSPPLLSRGSESGFQMSMQSGTNGTDLPSGVLIYTALARVLLLSSFVILCTTAFYPHKGILSSEVGRFGALEV